MIEKQSATVLSKQQPWLPGLGEFRLQRGAKSQRKKTRMSLVRGGWVGGWVCLFVWLVGGIGGLVWVGVFGLVYFCKTRSRRAGSCEFGLTV